MLVMYNSCCWVILTCIYYNHWFKKYIYKKNAKKNTKKNVKKNVLKKGKKKKGLFKEKNNWMNR